MYVSERDLAFFKSIQEELMNNFRLQDIEYLSIKNIAMSVDDYDNIYNEVPKENIQFEDPISIKAYVIHHKREDTISEYGLRYKRTITVMIHKDYEVENGLNIGIGQFFRWDDHLYQILHQEGDDIQVWGNPEWQVYNKYFAALK